MRPTQASPTTKPKLLRITASLWLALATAAPLGAQDGKSDSLKPTSRPAAHSIEALRRIVADREPLARLVPIEASIYFRMSDHEKWSALLGGSDPLGTPDTPDLNSFLAGRPRAVAMLSWQKRPEMITLCQPNDPAAFAAALHLGPAELVRHQDGVKVYHLPGGQWAATNGQAYVFSDIGEGSALFSQSMRLMLPKTERKSLLDDPRFGAYMRQVDSRASGVLFVDEPWEQRLGRLDTQDRFRPAWLPNLQSGYVEFHLDPGQVRCKLHAARRGRQLGRVGQDPPLSQRGNRRVQTHPTHLLPRSTIAAWTMPVDMLSLVKWGTRFLPRNQPSFYRQLARTVETYDLTGLMPLTDIGPRSTGCILSRPQAAGPIRLAWIIEAKRTAAAVAALAQMCRGVAAVINAHQLTAAHKVEVMTSKHAELEIHELRITRIDGNSESEIFGDIRPSFCAVGDHIVLASEPTVIHEIIDAWRQDGYALPMFEDWDAEGSGSAIPTYVGTRIRGFADPRKLAAELLPLQRALTSDDEALLENEWFTSFRDYFNATPVQLGARLQRDNPQTPGKVLVRHVLEDGPSAGKLRPGDYILGIDGELLALASPTEDLKKKLLAKPSGGTRSLRIERHGKIREVDVLLPKPSSKSLRGLMLDTGQAIGYLAALGDTVETVTYREIGDSAAQLNAEIILKLRSR